ncbi:hypothetical protein CEG14_22010 [Bordetella genomosp. 1]|uniref:DUF4148 domain-containing protein n=1 Tax=Bordetella genomosp. 1 TaxID=1395607 RepID=A0A261RWJ4_9BORD|nr:DUF4148 domain-containing protein [Bordetella genomosp. 1]MDQ8031125.1 hypothetical protein [Bordetella sp.]OZI29295.1 hypothetical protein CEG14_22010 [Bordetella genomosp. 1]OZI64975.1 hypothetical protein CAL27_07790 [Bordetella genomosp. 1]
MKALSIQRITAAVLLSSAFAIVAHAQNSPAAPQAAQAQAYGSNAKKAITRAEVERDLQAWKASGLGQEWNGEDTPEMDSPAYEAMYEHYLQLTGRNAVAQPGAGVPRS